MTDDPITIGELGGYTNNQMNKEGLKKLVNKVNEGGGVTYTAGDNIQISAENVISATDTVYTAGDNIEIVDGVISANGWEIVPLAEIPDLKNSDDRCAEDFIITTFLYSRLTGIGIFIKNSPIESDMGIIPSNQYGGSVDSIKLSRSNLFNKNTSIVSSTSTSNSFVNVNTGLKQYTQLKVNHSESSTSYIKRESAIGASDVSSVIIVYRRTQ